MIFKNRVQSIKFGSDVIPSSQLYSFYSPGGYSPREIGVQNVGNLREI